MFSIPDRSFESFENYTVELSAKEQNGKQNEHTQPFLILLWVCQVTRSFEKTVKKLDSKLQKAAVRLA